MPMVIFLGLLICSWNLFFLIHFLMDVWSAKSESEIFIIINTTSIQLKYKYKGLYKLSRIYKALEYIKMLIQPIQPIFRYIYKFISYAHTYDYMIILWIYNPMLNPKLWLFSAILTVFKILWLYDNMTETLYFIRLSECD